VFLKEEIKKLENSKEPKPTINRNIRLIFLIPGDAFGFAIFRI